MTTPRFDEDVLGPILGRGADDPAMLWELLSSVDAVHQTFIDVDALNAALGRLAAAGLIRELPGHAYVDAVMVSNGPGGPAVVTGSAALTPISETQWQAAVEEFQVEFERLNTEANEPYPRLTVIGPAGGGPRSGATGGPPTDADVERARDLRDQMTSALSLAGVTVMTAEVAIEGPAVTFWMAGFDEAGPDRMEEAARPVFLAAAPGGSTMAADVWDALAEGELPRDFWVIAPKEA